MRASSDRDREVEGQEEGVGQRDEGRGRRERKKELSRKHRLCILWIVKE